MQLPIRKTAEPIKLDGILDDAAWQNAFVAKDFQLNFPVDTAQAPFQTEVRVTFNNQFLYIGFTCFDDNKPYIVQSLKRDFDFENNDNVTVLLGPYNDKQNGFFFAITPYNVQMEGTVAQGGTNDNSFNSDWDNKWFSKTTRYPDKWVAEIAIPFKSIRYKEGEWNINFLRWDRKHNYASNWIAVPIQYSAGAYAYSGQLMWEDQAPKPSVNVSLIPFISGGLSRDSIAEERVHDSDIQIGGDAKIGITPSMNLDLTVNPDFSQVDVDQQVVNLTRLEFQFPERRQFFLENSDLFGNAGFPQTRPFFSRRIGIARDTTEDKNLTRVPILFGARLSGSINKDWRVSAMNMLTRETKKLGLPAQNYTVATLMRNFGAQSNIAVTYVEKTSLGLDNLKDSVRYFNQDVLRHRDTDNGNEAYFNKFSRAFTIDMDLLSKDNKWYSSYYYSIAQNPYKNDKNHSGGVFSRYNSRALDVFLGSNFQGANYNSEAGFVPLYDVYPGQWSWFASVNGKFYPKKGGIAFMGPQSNLNFTYLPGGTGVDRNLGLGYAINFKNSMSLEANWGYNYVNLTNSFNPIDDGPEFEVGETFNWHEFNLEFNSNQRSVVNFNAEVTAGGFFNGTALRFQGQLNYRYQPIGSLAIRVDYNDVRLGGNYGKEKLFVIGPRLDLTFTNSLFFTTFVQYNNVDDNIGLNTRLQWRYKPASDFFIVYTENYLPENLGSKNRAIVFKFTYWLNL